MSKVETDRTSLPVEPLLNKREVAQALGLSTRTLERLVSLRQFPPPLKLGPTTVRWRAQAVRAYLERQEQAAAAAAR